MEGGDLTENTDALGEGGRAPCRARTGVPDARVASRSGAPHKCWPEPRSGMLFASASLGARAWVVCCLFFRRCFCFHRPRQGFLKEPALCAARPLVCHVRQPMATVLGDWLCVVARACAHPRARHPRTRARRTVVVGEKRKPPRLHPYETHHPWRLRRPVPAPPDALAGWRVVHVRLQGGSSTTAQDVGRTQTWPRLDHYRG